MPNRVESVKRIKEEVFWRVFGRVNSFDSRSKVDGVCPTEMAGNYCAICQSTYSNLHYHLQEETHIRRMEDLRIIKNTAVERMSSILAKAAEYEPMIQQLESEIWKEDFRRQLLPTYATLSQILFTGNPPPSSLVLDPKMISIKVFRERMAILELAVWKNITIAKEGDNHCVNGAMYRSFEKRGWKEHKARYHKTGSIQVVLEFVAPFLERHEPFVRV